MRLPRRLARERKTLQTMVKIFCRNHHSPGDNGHICPDCKALLAYADKRLSRCSFQNQKPTCGNCPIHCYKKDMRTKVRDVMRYCGPRMIKHHPFLALCHLFDTMRKVPEMPIRSRQTEDRAPKRVKGES
ncbi:MAG: nitrous oxide-stimulated promoter family protein [Desulforhopalus sp.]